VSTSRRCRDLHVSGITRLHFAVFEQTQEGRIGMALIKCHECGGQVSTEASACPKCGAAVRIQAQKPPRRSAWRLLGLVMLAGVVVSVVIQAQQKAKLDAMTPEERKAAEDARDASGKRFAVAHEVVKAIKADLHDPASLQLVSVRLNDDATVACVEYRAKNKLGATVKSSAVYVEPRLHSESARQWNAHCVASLHDYTRSMN
jgi:hypothetical protein